SWKNATFGSQRLTDLFRQTIRRTASTITRTCLGKCGLGGFNSAVGSTIKCGGVLAKELESAPTNSTTSPGTRSPVQVSTYAFGSSDNRRARSRSQRNELFGSSKGWLSKRGLASGECQSAI